MLSCQHNLIAKGWPFSCFSVLLGLEFVNLGGFCNMRARTLLNVSIVTLAVLFLILIIGDYATQSWHWVGVSAFTAPSAEYQHGKTLWDWLSLLVIPITIVLGVWWLNRQERSAQREIAQERVEQDRKMVKEGEERNVLQSYFESITVLLVDKDLRTNVVTSDEIKGTRWKVAVWSPESETILPITITSVFFFLVAVTLMGLVAKLITDLCYVLVDPRIQFESQNN